jgi:hypothetical protein
MGSGAWFSEYWLIPSAIEHPPIKKERVAAIIMASGCMEGICDLLLALFLIPQAGPSWVSAGNSPLSLLP